MRRGIGRGGCVAWRVMGLVARLGGFRRAALMGLPVVGLTFVFGGSVLAAPAFAADTETIVFATRGAYTFTVPPGVTSVTISAVGAAGGSTPFVDASFDCDSRGAAGGQGASVTGTFPVSGGEPLQVGVGAPGGSVSQCSTGQPADGGYGGGGMGGSSGGNIGGSAGVVARPRSQSRLHRLPSTHR
jgi:hypothetical protein